MNAKNWNQKVTNKNWKVYLLVLKIYLKMKQTSKNAIM